MTGSSDLYELEGVADKRQRVSKKDNSSFMQHFGGCVDVL